MEGALSSGRLYFTLKAESNRRLAKQLGDEKCVENFGRKTLRNESLGMPRLYHRIILNRNLKILD